MGRRKHGSEYLVAFTAVFLLLAPPIRAEELTKYVNPFIGTAGGGNTFPGAVCPWGMVSVSPHTDLQAPSGYIHGRPWFYGLGQTHLSGTGCADLGSIIVTATAGEANGSPERYKSTLKDQEAHPGYWAGTLVEPSLRAEATATVRSGITRFTTLSRVGFTLQFDVGRSLSLIGGGAVRWTSERDLEGWNNGGGFCGEQNRHRVYFAAHLSEKPTVRGTWRSDSVARGLSAEALNSDVGAWARMAGKPRGPIEIRIGISYVSIANAHENLKTETGGRTFEDLRRAADRSWELELSRIRVSGGSPEDLTKFYTALYHSLIHPNVISDVNGEYPLFARNGTGKNISRDRYSVFSLWDTYRTLHPLLTLVYPERQSSMVSTMIDMFSESGWLPKWELASNETHMMVGDGAVAVVAESYLKGIKGIDTLLAYAAVKKPMVAPTADAEPSRPGYGDFLKRGFIPVDQDTTHTWWVWGPVSTMLEYCYADWAVSRVAASLGHADDAREFHRRSLLYRNLFDTASGFLRPRRSDGSWLVPFDPVQTEGSGNWSGSGGPGYVEGNAWQYTWFVPHDVEGLITLFGGSDRCAEKLSHCFADNRFTINNEPDIAYPYLFTYLPGHEQRTAPLVRSIMKEQFGIGPAGLPGNDDAGTISAWFVFSALGIYPACPASGEYRLGVPLFKRASISLNPKYFPGRVIDVRFTGPGSSSNRVSRITWNNKELTKPAIEHHSIILGGRLVFKTAE